MKTKKYSILRCPKAKEICKLRGGEAEHTQSEAELTDCKFTLKLAINYTSLIKLFLFSSV